MYLLHSPNGVNGVASQLVECFVSEPVVRKYYEQQEAAGEKTHPWDMKAEQCLQIALRPENFNPSLPSHLRAQIVSELSRPDRICVWSFAPGVFRETEFEVQLKPHSSLKSVPCPRWPPCTGALFEGNSGQIYSLWSS